jgi:predicted nucleotidyltransferase
MNIYTPLEFVKNRLSFLKNKPKMHTESLNMSAGEDFYKFVLKKLVDNKIPFLIAGTYALTLHTGIKRQTKDLDIFCKASDYPIILDLFRKDGFKSMVDERWIAKIYKGKQFMDFIFNTTAGICPVDDTWFQNAPEVMLLGYKVKVIRADDMVWTKSFRQERHVYDGPDINHLLLKKGKEMDWKRLMTHMEPYWELLYGHILNFRFVYPGYRENIPKWVVEELNKRVAYQLSTRTITTSLTKVCRGRLISPSSYYDIDYEEWGFIDNLQVPYKNDKQKH